MIGLEILLQKTKQFLSCCEDVRFRPLAVTRQSNYLQKPAVLKTSRTAGPPCERPFLGRSIKARHNCDGSSLSAAE
jgi:hypothetical protein